MSIHHDKIELVDDTFIRYRAVFIFYLGMYTTLAKWNMYSVSVKYIFDYKVKFLRYTRTYIKWSCFVSFLSLHILFRFVSQFTYFVSFLFRCVTFRFTVFRFVSQFTGTLKLDHLDCYKLNRRYTYIKKNIVVTKLCKYIYKWQSWQDLRKKNLADIDRWTLHPINLVSVLNLARTQIR